MVQGGDAVLGGEVKLKGLKNQSLGTLPEHVSEAEMLMTALTNLNAEQEKQEHKAELHNLTYYPVPTSDEYVKEKKLPAGEYQIINNTRISEVAEVEVAEVEDASKEKQSGEVCQLFDRNTVHDLQLLMENARKPQPERQSAQDMNLFCTPEKLVEASLKNYRMISDGMEAHTERYCERTGTSRDELKAKARKTFIKAARLEDTAGERLTEVDLQQKVIKRMRGCIELGADWKDDEMRQEVKDSLAQFSQASKKSKPSTWKDCKYKDIVQYIQSLDDKLQKIRAEEKRIEANKVKLEKQRQETTERVAKYDAEQKIRDERFYTMYNANVKKMEEIERKMMEEDRQGRRS